MKLKTFCFDCRGSARTAGCAAVHRRPHHRCNNSLRVSDEGLDDGDGQRSTPSSGTIPIINDMCYNNFLLFLLSCIIIDPVQVLTGPGSIVYAWVKLLAHILLMSYGYLFSCCFAGKHTDLFGLSVGLTCRTTARNPPEPELLCELTFELSIEKTTRSWDSFDGFYNNAARRERKEGGNKCNPGKKQKCSGDAAFKYRNMFRLCFPAQVVLF